MQMGEAEKLVADLFKIPARSARTLVSAAVARYSVELEEALAKRIAATLDEAPWNKDADRWEVTLADAFIRERLFDELQRGNQPDPVRAGVGAVWRFPDETYQWLRAQHALAGKPKPK
jgi:hypothetical protein